MSQPTDQALQNTLNTLAYELAETNKNLAEIANLILLLKQKDDNSAIPGVALSLSQAAKQRVGTLQTIKEELRECVN